MARILLGLILLAGIPAVFSLEVPKLSSRVTDLAGILTAEQVRNLEQKLQDLERTDSTQIALLIIPSLEGEVLEDYSHRVASAWRLGQKGRDNGALLLIAMKERRVRIEVGYGLEATLTDALSRRIIEREIVPSFRAGNYPAGIDAAVAALIAAVRGSYQSEPDKPSGNRPGPGQFLNWIFWFLFPLLFVIHHFGKWVSALVGAVVGFFILKIFALPWWITFPFGGGGGFLVGLLLGAILPRSGPGRHWHTGRTHHGGSWGDFGGGGFSGGGDFSGGGGSFGGGGASGRW